MVWKTVESSVTGVKKAVVKARVLTGTYILQKNRQTFSNGTVDAVQCMSTLPIGRGRLATSVVALPSILLHPRIYSQVTERHCH